MTEADRYQKPLWAAGFPPSRLRRLLVPSPFAHGSCRAGKCANIRRNPGGLHGGGVGRAFINLPALPLQPNL